MTVRTTRLELERREGADGRVRWSIQAGSEELAAVETEPSVDARGAFNRMVAQVVQGGERVTS